MPTGRDIIAVKTTVSLSISSMSILTDVTERTRYDRDMTIFMFHNDLRHLRVLAKKLSTLF